MKEIYGIKEIENKGAKKSYWTRIGIAHVNKDGSLNCYFDFFPARTDNGKITIQIREKTEKKGEKNGTGNEEVEF